MIDDCVPVLPDSYVPTKLRPSEPEFREEVMYAIGTEHKRGEFGMWQGPNPELIEMLEVVGKSRRDCILRFNLDGTDEVLYRWHGDRWVKK